jgi:hypothetical protein
MNGDGLWRVCAGVGVDADVRDEVGGSGYDCAPLKGLGDITSGMERLWRTRACLWRARRAGAPGCRGCARGWICVREVEGGGVW